MALWRAIPGWCPPTSVRGKKVPYRCYMPSSLSLVVTIRTQEDILLTPKYFATSAQTNWLSYCLNRWHKLLLLCLIRSFRTLLPESNISLKCQLKCVLCDWVACVSAVSDDWSYCCLFPFQMTWYTFRRLFSQEIQPMSCFSGRWEPNSYFFKGSIKAV